MSQIYVNLADVIALYNVLYNVLSISDLDFHAGIQSHYSF